MLLSRRVVSAAAARAVHSRTAQSLVRFYSADADAAAAETPAAASSTPAAPAAKTTPVATTSKWVARPKPAFATSTTSRSQTAFATSTTSRSQIPEQPAPYEPTTIAHQAGDAGDAAAAAPNPPSTGVNWANSFHGIATKPVTEAQFKVLMAPLDLKDIEVKPDGVIYLPEIKYRRRLNETFGPMGWGLIPKGESVVGNNIVTREYALIVDGRFVSQAQGENGYFSPEQLPSAVEGCKSNALMRCCKDLGIGSELWDPHFIRWFRKAHMEEVWVEHTTTKKKRTFWYRKGQVDVAYPYKSTK